MSTPADEAPDSAGGDAGIGEVGDGITSELVDGLIDDILIAGDESPSGADETDPVARAETERDVHLLDLQRVSAEFANFRTQTERRNAEVASRARGDLAERLLPVLDACDLALGHGAEDVAPIHAALVNALAPVGLEILDPVGEPFDPTRHEAVLHEPAGEDDAGGTQVVVEVLRRGYVWSGRVLRPAMVKVRG